MFLPKFRSSLVLRTSVVVFGVALAIGLVVNEVVGQAARRYETGRIQDRVRELLVVVEPSASAACFVGDRQLARETAAGLLNSPSIAGVVIRTPEGVLAEAWRSPSEPGAVVVTHPIPSPFAKGQEVGRIQVNLDAREAARNAARYVWAFRALSLLVAVAVGAALAYTATRLIARPIKQVSDRLHGLDARQGTRLDTPAGHEVDEIGRLVRRVNRALDAVEAQRRLEQEMQQEQRLSSLGRLAGGVAHDFNNMLAGIMGSTELLLQGETDGARQKHLLGILDAATHSSELVTKLLAFGRRGKNRVEAVDLEATLRGCLAMVRPSMHADLRLVESLEPGLSIDGDPVQVQHVIVNLCVNAVEAMKGAGTLTLTTRTVVLPDLEAKALKLAPGAYAELTVADTGCGMDEALLQRIFEPFVTTKPHLGQGRTGTGLGLSTVLGIVEAHHGVVKVASTVGEGSVFRVFWPKGVLAPAPSQAQAAATEGKGTILVVDDEPLIREVVEAALESLGYQAETAPDGQSAVAVFQTMHTRLRAVLLDLKMPHMGGHEAFFLMRAIDPTVPVVVCTGYGDNEEVQSILSGGGMGMLAKPYRIAELAETLDRILGQRSGG